MERNEKAPRIKEKEEHTNEMEITFKEEEILLGESSLSHDFRFLLISSR